MLEDRRYRFDLEKALSTMLSLGLAKQSWDDRPVPELRGVGDSAGREQDLTSR